MIDVNEKIEVSCSPRTVWNLLSDPHKVVDCVPGAELGEEHEDGTFDGTMTVQFGPTKVAFKANVALELDDDAMSGNVIAKGKDKQGGARFTANMKFKVDEQPETQGSQVLIDAEVDVTGKFAHLIETGAKFVVKRITAQFSERLTERCGIQSPEGSA